MTAAFLASLVEAVEALTIVLAVATVRGWRPAGLGALAGLGCLALVVLVLGPLLDRVPLHVLQLVIGVLLLLFGMRWLRKAILRASGVIPLHDEASALAVGVMLAAFGVFWTGEGLGVPWPGADLAIAGFAALFLVAALAAVALARRPAAEALL